MPLGARPLEGEHDCRLGLTLGPGSMEDDRELGAPGLPLVAESGLSGSVVLKFGGASSEKPGISEGFHGLDFTVGDAPRDGTGFLAAVGAGLETESEGFDGGADILGVMDGMDGRRVGVDALDADLDGGTVGLEVGVEDLAVDLDGVEDLEGTVDLVAGAVDLFVGVVDLIARVVDLFAGVVDLFAGVVDLFAGVVDLVVGTVDLGAEFMDLFNGKVAREVGVDDLEGLGAEGNVGRPVGVAGLDPGPPDDEGLRVPELEELSPGEEVDCLDTKLLLAAGSGWGFANYDTMKK
ncbi:hypothetical protein C1H46_038497 [Malus baccata]|uniref:Uncharacterized protein n=1 Tax=Malus baccata TaxID=106549 RepID=A0A540KP06_MALBA|nr:hypothetical protein C1H46_038497 [Malus baccata]